MTDMQRRAIFSLSGCTFLPGCYDKRFVRDMVRLRANPESELSEKQDAFLMRLLHKYRRQHKACNCLECFQQSARRDQPSQVKLFEEWEQR